MGITLDSAYCFSGLARPWYARAESNAVANKFEHEPGLALARPAS
jgi:hypothetical protein